MDEAEYFYSPKPLSARREDASRHHTGADPPDSRTWAHRRPRSEREDPRRLRGLHSAAWAAYQYRSFSAPSASARQGHRGSLSAGQYSRSEWVAGLARRLWHDFQPREPPQRADDAPDHSSGWPGPPPQATGGSGGWLRKAHRTSRSGSPQNLIQTLCADLGPLPGRSPAGWARAPPASAVADQTRAHCHPWQCQQGYSR